MKDKPINYTALIGLCIVTTFFIFVYHGLYGFMETKTKETNKKIAAVVWELSKNEERIQRMIAKELNKTKIDIADINRGNVIAGD